MGRRTVDIIKSEHRNISGVLDALAQTVDALPPAGGAGQNTDAIYAMLYYIRVFPDRFHHPKEDDHLFEALSRRAPEARGLIEQLESEHARSEALLADLDKALKAYERGRRGARERLQRKVHDYVDKERRHMQREEEEILPLAERALRKDDWAAIDDIFARNADPLFDGNVEFGFRSLYKRIVGKDPETR